MNRTTIDVLTYCGDRGWLEVDGEKVWVETANDGLPQLWVHRRPGTDAMHYFYGRSLTDGTDEENTEYAKSLIRARKDVK